MKLVIGRRIARGIALTLVAVVLNGCAFLDGNLFEDSFWASSPFKKNEEAELGLAELAKGNYVTAEGHFQKALRANSRDVYALLGSGILYQNTGQLVKSREMYEAVLAIRPDESVQFMVWNQLATRPASQVASVNLSLLDTNGTAQAAMVSPIGGQTISGAPSGDVMLGRPVTQTASAAPTQMAPASSNPTNARVSTEPAMDIGRFSGADANVISRFATLRALRDQGLITQDEFQQRRRSNLGALLPQTSPPSAAGLDRPVPTTEQISARLRAIGRALEMRAISVSQHAAERNIILDALLPAAPVMIADPALPPNGLLEAADAVRRLEILRDSGYISSDEYARERQAIELAAQTRPGQAQTPAKAAESSAASSEPVQMAKAEPAAPSGGPQPAVHLASYRSAKQAESGWVQIKRAQGDLLGDIGHTVSRVTLGSKGTYFRLKAGPLPSTDQARALCSKLKQRRQYCDTTVLSDG